MVSGLIACRLLIVVRQLDLAVDLKSKVVPRRVKDPTKEVSGARSSGFWRQGIRLAFVDISDRIHDN